jgi:hypothetical protein
VQQDEFSGMSSRVEHKLLDAIFLYLANRAVMLADAIQTITGYPECCHYGLHEGYDESKWQEYLGDLTFEQVRLVLGELAFHENGPEYMAWLLTNTLHFVAPEREKKKTN